MSKDTQTFEEFWSDVIDYCQEVNITTQYAEDEFIGTHKDNITTWCHGHIHHTNDYNVAGVRILSNPRGYAKYNENPDFNPEFEFELGTVQEVAQEVPVEA